MAVNRIGLPAVSGRLLAIDARARDRLVVIRAAHRTLHTNHNLDDDSEESQAIGSTA